MEKAIQDFYPDEFAHCYGCGHKNEHGHRIKSFLEGDETVCHYKPEPFYTGGFPDKMYGGLIASLIDCHGAATASAARVMSEGFKIGEKPAPRFVTASLKVDYLKPTPMDATLELRGKAVEIKDRKIVVHVTLSAKGIVTAKGEVILVQLPEK